MRQFIFHLKPDGDLKSFLEDTRHQASQRFGADSSYLYLPHVSMSGYFRCSEQEARQLGCRLQEMFNDCVPAYCPSNRPPLRNQSPDLSRVSTASSQSQPSSETNAKSVVWIHRIITTDDGYVLMDLESGFLREAMERLAELARKEGIEVRSKPLNHVTLARDRFDANEKQEIREFWEKEYFKHDFSNARWCVVVYELIERTPIAELATRGPHRLNEIISIPVTRSRG